MKLDVYLQDFITDCRLRGLSPRTIQDYEEFVGRFVFGKKNPSIETLKEDVANYTFDLISRSLSRSTVATYLRHLKVFIGYLEKQGVVSGIAERMKIPREQKKVVQIYDEPQIQQLFKMAMRGPEWLKYRNAAIIALMLDSGLRLEEVTKIKVSDIQDQTLKVTGKGNKERIVPLGASTLCFIESYRKAFDHRGILLFMTKTGKPLSRETIKQMIAKIQHRVDFDFSAHKLRHNFATNYCLDQYERTGSIDIYSLMALLGHADIQTTKRYLHMATSILAAKYHKSHLDGLGLDFE